MQRTVVGRQRWQVDTMCLSRMPELKIHGYLVLYSIIYLVKSYSRVFGKGYRKEDLPAGQLQWKCFPKPRRMTLSTRLKMRSSLSVSYTHLRAHETRHDL